MVPLALARLEETRGPAGRLDLPGLGLASAGLFGIVWGLVRGNPVGWGRGRIAAVSSATVGYGSLVAPFVVSGIGMALFFAPVANVVLSAVRPDEEGQASGANNAIRELGGVFGVAVLASIFSSYGGYGTGQTFVDGLTPAISIGAAIVALGAVVAFAVPSARARAP